MISVVNYDDSDDDDLIGPPVPESLKQSEKCTTTESNLSELDENDEIGPPVPKELQQNAEGKGQKC